MKPEIHPQYIEATVTCSCGNSFQTRSTQATIRTDLCSVCHPFYTGEQRIVDTAGQVERFNRRVEAAQAASAKSKRQRRIDARLQAEAERAAALAESAADESTAPAGEVSADA
jgi:large subunit ribosomal protein L31